MLVQDMQNTIESILKGKGFDEVDCRSVGYCYGWRTGYNVDFKCYDGNEVTYFDETESEFSSIIEKAHAIPSRERRDLKRLARKLAEIDAMSDSLVSVMGKAFVADLKERSKPIHSAITHIKGSE